MNDDTRKPTTDPSFDAWLVERMDALDVTGKTLAAVTAIDPATISRYRGGTTPTGDHAYLLRKALSGDRHSKAAIKRAEAMVTNRLPMIGTSAARAPRITRREVERVNG